MTQEEKQLLLKDLCARLPYGVICKVVANDNPWIGDCKLRCFWLDKVTDICYEIKPYLRPMSSMTEEEKYEYRHLLGAQLNSEGESILFVYIEDLDVVVDWLNKNHFDYRGIIEKGLALEAPEDMYKTE